MTYRGIVIGTCGLVLTVVWAMALVSQWQGVESLFGVLASDAPVVFRLKAFIVWSLIERGATSVLIVPVMATSVAAMFGARRSFGLLRSVLRISPLLSAGTLVIYAGLVAPVVVSGGPLLPFGARINNGLLAATAALSLQIIMIVLLRRGGRTPAGPEGSVAAKRTGQMSHTALQPTSRDRRTGHDQRGLAPRQWEMNPS